MSTRALAPVEEYLRMSFPGSDPEYLDGEPEEVYGAAGLGAIQKSDVFE